MAPPDFRSPFLGEDPIEKAKRQARKREHWTALVVRRQRLLKAHGYNVVVDGNWGKRSSSAWWRFKRGKPPVAGRPRISRPAVMGESARDKARVFEQTEKLAPAPKAPSIAEKALKGARARAEKVHDRPLPDLSHASAKALAAAPRHPKGPRDRDVVSEHIDTVQRGNIVETARVVERQQAEQRFHKAWAKKDDPGKWTTDDIAALFADPMTRVTDWVNKPEWVRRIQSWLYAHGHSIFLNGVWDAPTADAVRAEMERRARNLQRFRARQLSQKVYGPLGIKPGDKGFPVLGTAPTPEKLLEIADAGGLTAETLFASLAKMLGDLKRGQAWRNYQDEYLDSILQGGRGFAQARSAFGPFIPDWMLNEMTPVQKYAAILLGFQSIYAQGETQGAEVASVENNPEKKGDTFFQEVRAVAQASSVEDLTRRVKIVRQADEKAYQNIQALRAAGDDWFTGIAKASYHALGVPTKEAQDALVTAQAALNTFFTPALSSAGRGGGHGFDYEQRVKLFHEENERLHALWGQWEKDHPILGFGVDMIVDPLNLIPAAWIAETWRMTKAGLKAAERVGEVTRVASEGRSLPVRILGEGAGTAFKLPAAYGRGVKLGAQAGAKAVRESKVGRVTRSVRESTDAVTRTVRTAFGHGFAASHPADPLDVAEIKDGVRKMLTGLEAENPGSGRRFNILDEIDRFRVGTYNEMTSRFQDVVNLSARQRLSLVAHADRQTSSDWGRALEGTLSSHLFSAEADKYAAKLADEEFNKILAAVHEDLVGQAAFREKLRRFHDLIEKREAARKAGRELTEAEQREFAEASADWRGYVRANPVQRGRSAIPTPKVKHKIPTIREPVSVPIPEDEFAAMLARIAETESGRVYREAMKNVGSYHGGGQFEVNKLIVERVRDRLDVYKSAVEPALQDAIERSLHEYETSLIGKGLRPEGWEPQGLFTKGGFARGNRAKTTLLLRDILRDTFDDLDRQFGPNFERTGSLPSVKQLRAELMDEVEQEFALREQALAQRESQIAQDDQDLRQSLLGERLAVLRLPDGREMNTAIRPKETVEQAAARFADENGLDLSRFTIEEGESVRRFPVLISKKDSGTVIFGKDAEEFLTRAREGGADASGYLLGEARIGAKGKVSSLANNLVDLSSGELRYESRAFNGAAAADDPKFRKAINDLKGIDKKITSMLERKRAAGRAKVAHVKEQAWTPEDEKRLSGLRRSKRKLIEQNPASRAYFVRGTAKRAVTRHVENLLHRSVGDAVAAEKAALHEEKLAAIREVDDQVHELRTSLTETQPSSKVWVENADFGRTFTQDEYDEFVSMMVERRSVSVSQWAARRRIAGDAADDAIVRAVEKAIDDETAKVKGWFKDNGDGSFAMTSKGHYVPAIYARHTFRAYDDALKGRHPILTAEDVPADVKRVLSVAATPADRATGAVQGIERMAALLSGARPYPVFKRFEDIPEQAGQVVKGRRVVFERSVPNRVGVAQGTRMAADVSRWHELISQIRARGWEYRDFGGDAPTDFAHRYDGYRGLLKVAETHAYPRVTLRHGAVFRALKEAQSGPLQEINNLLEMARTMFVFSVLPGRPAALFRNVFDSVLKILVTGLHDPRYWIAQGATKGELEARRKLAAISKDARAATGTDVVNSIRELTRASDDADAVARQGAADVSESAVERVTESVTNIFQLGVNELDQMVRLMVGPKYADAMASIFRHTFNTAFWGRPIEEVRKALRINAVDVRDEVIFGIQTVLHDGVAKRMVPRGKLTLEDWAAIDGIKEGDVKAWVKEVTADPKRLNNVQDPRFVLMSHTADVMWDLMVGRPEGWLRRGLYRSEYAKALKRTGDEMQAHIAGMKAVDHSLFDYSKVTVLDENLKHLIPFYFFWRRNLAFWATNAIKRPWLPAALVKWEDAMEEAHSDQPSWTRRYVRIPFLTDTIAKLPVANWVLGSGGNFEVGTDPLSFVSAAPLYRAFKGENPTLPPDRAGIPFISGLIDGMNDFGLSMSPWFRKPAELTGILNYRAWQAMFPQTSVVDALSERFLHEMFPDGLNIEETLQDSVFQAVGVGLNAKELNERRINEWVQTEVAAQAERGEPIDRAKAEKRIKQFVYLQTMFAFTSGAYLRHLDPAQLQLYKIQEQLHLGEIDYLDDLTPQEQKAYSLFIRRKMNPGAYNEYLKVLPKIEAFHALEDFDDGQDYLQENPEVIPHVMPERTGKPVFRGDGLKNVGLIVDTEVAINVQKAFDNAGIKEPGIRERISNYFVTPELREFWARNDTPSERRTRMVQGEVYRHVRSLREAYFALPEKDHGARASFLDDNPILAHWFTVNDEASDDLRDVLNYVNNDLREVYFEHVERKDWDGAAAFLKRFPRIFELTKAEDQVSDDGLWLPAKVGTKRAKDYQEAYPHLQHYFALRKQNKKLAYKWLDGDTPGAKLVRAYFKNYADPTSGTKGQHARDYLALKSTLSWFFDKLPEDGKFRGFYSKWGWVFESNDPAAKKLRAYFRKYAKKGGMTQHAKDYVAVKDQLQHYFKLREAGKDDEADAFLHSQEGKGVLAYFKKYGKTNAAARKWGKWVRSQNPEVNRRLMFWKTYFELPPDQRPGFVHRRAEHYGIFIWGRDADQARHDKEQAYLRKAKKRHLTKKAALYLKSKPLLDLFHTLDDRDKKILLRLSPDLREYLDTYSKGPRTGSKELDKKVEGYFDLPPDSAERSEYLRANPEVQDYFDEKNPADAAMHNLLEVYFGIEDTKDRSKFADLHPEISDYFDRKREEKGLLSAELRTFDEADPRLDELRERAQLEIVQAAEVMWSRLRGDSATRLAGDDIAVRRERDEKAVKSRRLTL